MHKKDWWEKRKEASNSESRKKRKQVIFLSIFIIAIMVLSTLGFILGQTEEEEGVGAVEKYGGYEFYMSQSGKWVVDVNKKSYWLDYFPKEVEKISIPDITPQEKIYIIFEPSEKDENMDYSISKLAYTLSNLGKRVVLACASEKDCPDIPLKGCNGAEYPFYFKKGPESTEKSFKDGNCLVIQGDAVGMSRVVDKVTLKLLGIEQKPQIRVV